MLLMTSILLMLGVTIAAPWLLSQHARRLPYAPACPHCRAVTGQTPAHGVLDRVYALLAATPVRICTRCGWAGRMRWRLATERARGRRT